jgi:hypothetical protein
MATSKQKIRVYVSKVETQTGEFLIIKSNFDEKDFSSRFYHNLGVPLHKKSSEEILIEDMKNYISNFFKNLSSKLENESVKFDVEYFFNKEYKAIGQLNTDETFCRVYWVDLIKPLTDKEIELFVRALRLLQ